LTAAMASAAASVGSHIFRVLTPHTIRITEAAKATAAGRAQGVNLGSQ